jgi:hypothetical protein
MSTLTDRTIHSLDTKPTATAIADLRDEANAASEAVAAALPDDADAFLVVSPRGTCVLLENYLKRASWPPQEDAETVATELSISG